MSEPSVKEVLEKILLKEISKITSEIAKITDKSSVNLEEEEKNVGEVTYSYTIDVDIKKLISKISDKYNSQLLAKEIVKSVNMEEKLQEIISLFQDYLTSDEFVECINSIKLEDEFVVVEIDENKNKEIINQFNNSIVKCISDEVTEHLEKIINSTKPFNFWDKIKQNWKLIVIGILVIVIIILIFTNIRANKRQSGLNNFTQKTRKPMIPVPKGRQKPNLKGLTNFS